MLKWVFQIWLEPRVEVDRNWPRKINLRIFFQNVLLLKYKTKWVTSQKLTETISYIAEISISPNFSHPEPDSSNLGDSRRCIQEIFIRCRRLSLLIYIVLHCWTQRVNSIVSRFGRICFSDDENPLHSLLGRQLLLPVSSNQIPIFISSVIFHFCYSSLKSLLVCIFLFCVVWM